MLNHEQLKKDPQRITKIKPFINKHNWEGINFLSEKYDWKKLEKNNVLNAKKGKIYSAYVSKHNSNLEKQVILLMIPSKEEREAKSKGRIVKSEGQR